MPNVASPIIIQVSLSLGFALLVEAGLSYLGLGEQPPTPSWGSMLNEGYQFIFTTPWALVFPGLAIMLTVLSFNLVADGLRDSLGRERPKSSQPGRAPSSATRRSRLARLRGGSTRPTGPAGAPPPRAATAAPDDTLLSVKNLRIEFLTNGQWLPVMEEASFTRRAGQDAGAGRRERFGQDGLGPRRHGPAPAPRLPGQRDGPASRDATSCASPRPSSARSGATRSP